MAELLVIQMLIVTTLSSAKTFHEVKPYFYVRKLLSLYLPTECDMSIDALKYITRIAEMFHHKSLMPLKLVEVTLDNEGSVHCEVTAALYFHKFGLPCFQQEFMAEQPTGHLV